MLGNLFRSTSSYRNQSTLDSVTDDAHTRNLLFGHSHQVYTLSNSPPSSPLAASSFRPSSFDESGGLDLDDKDVRILLAQDAVGGDEKPTMLYDSRRILEIRSSPKSPQSGVRAPLPWDWKPSQTQPTNNDHDLRQRSRGSTVSTAQWSRPARDLSSLEDMYLSCMFGSTSATKPSASTKMHFIPAEVQPPNVTSKAPPDVSSRPRRAPLARSQTSGQSPSLSTINVDRGRDTILITRLFRVALPEHVQIAQKPDSNRAASQSHPDTSSPVSPLKRPKLVERKVPMYAIGLVIRLPQSRKSALTQIRPSSYLPSLHRAGSASSSYGPEAQFPWTFLDAIPTSLASLKNEPDGGDTRVEAIVTNWDIVLRGLSAFEDVASAAVRERLLAIVEQLDSVDMNESKEQKVPKEKTIQRINQRTVSIPGNGAGLASRALGEASDRTARRIARAVKMPRVVTGTGLAAGHWTDESRFLYRACGARQQNFFLMNLLTAFLGHHTEWLERLAPSRYRRTGRNQRTKDGDCEVLRTRTVLVSDQKGLARRLIYILASFLPGDHEYDGLHRLSESMEDSMLSLSSPSKRPSRQTSLRRRAQRRSQGRYLQADTEDRTMLSTSVSSADSDTPALSYVSPQKHFVRRDSNKLLLARTVRDQPSLVHNESQTASTGASATVSAQPATPVAYIAPARTSYFPESAIIDSGDSVASADLSKILNRAGSDSHRRSSSVSSRWNSLVNGLSDLWSNRSVNVAPGGSVSTVSQTSPAGVHKRVMSIATSKAPANPLEAMLGDLNKENLIAPGHTLGHQADPTSAAASSSWQRLASPPALHVDQDDGVVDVDLNLPGFISWSEIGSSGGNFADTHARAELFGSQHSSSLYSAHSLASHKIHLNDQQRVNVGGYLMQFHEDLTLQAVKEYAELEEDIKHAMRSERSSIDPVLCSASEDQTSKWTSVCSTLIANTKSFTIRRLSLRRRMVATPANKTQQNESTDWSAASRPSSTIEEEIVDETIMEFDTTIVEALEALLGMDGTDGMNPRSNETPRKGHSRQASVNINPNLETISKNRTQPDGSADPVKLDQRHVVIGALEQIIKSVDKALHDSQRTSCTQSSTQGQIQGHFQENILREGVKKWLLNVEQTKVW